MCQHALFTNAAEYDFLLPGYFHNLLQQLANTFNSGPHGPIKGQYCALGNVLVKYFLHLVPFH